MHVFHIRGFSSILILLLGILAMLGVLLALPATFCMVLWNALIFEGLKGPEIDLYQGFLLWGVAVVLIKLIFKPQIQFQIQSVGTRKDAKSSSTAASSRPVDETSTDTQATENAQCDQRKG